MNAIETIKEILDKSGTEYTEHGNGFDIEDVGGSISVLVDDNEAFGAMIENTDH